MASVGDDNVAVDPLSPTVVATGPAALGAETGRCLDGRFALGERLGRGGMGTVYRARQLSLGRDVAIKLIEPGLAADQSMVDRFLQEGRLASRLNHVNVISLYDFGQTEDGQLYLVMELADGETLEQRLADAGRFEPRRAIQLARQICNALEVAHEAQVMHRDLKPANIMVVDHLDGTEHLKVVDFGIARSFAPTDGRLTVTGQGTVLGSPAYVAPEVVTGAQVDSRADLYSLGVLLHEMLAGRLPFAADNINEMLYKHVQEAPASLPDDIPHQLREIVSALLAKDPGDRIQTAADVRRRLQSVGTSATSPAEKGTAMPTSLPETSDRQAGRLSALVLGSIVLLMALAFGGSLLLRADERAAVAAPAAEQPATAPPAQVHASSVPALSATPAAEAPLGDEEGVMEKPLVRAEAMPAKSSPEVSKRAPSKRRVALHITSEPAGASVITTEIGKGPAGVRTVCKTPCDQKISYRGPFSITIRKPGCGQKSTATLERNATRVSRHFELRQVPNSKHRCSP